MTRTSTEKLPVSASGKFLDRMNHYRLSWFGAYSGSSNKNRSEQNMAKHVLILDENDDLIVALGKTFKRRGFKLQYCGASDQALKSVKPKKLSAAVVEVDVPPVEDYQEILRALHLARVPIVVLSGHHPSEMSRRASGLGAVAFLHKSADAGEILNTLDNATRSR
jgi:DNA-binding NtrC family response regulator